MNNGSIVIELQNKEENITCLAAMRQIYRYQKKVLLLLFFLNIVIVILLAILASFLQSPVLNEWVALYGVLLTFFDVLLLTPLMKGYGDKAAAIQEIFDCKVLGLPEHFVKKPDFVDEYDIAQAAQVYYKNSGDTLGNWYSRVKSEMPSQRAVYTAQRTNIWWDKKQKEIFQRWAMITLIILSIIVVLTAFVQDLGIRSLLIYILPLILPAVIFWHQFHTGLVADITRLQKLESLMDGISVEEYTQNKARQMQDAIYEHRKQNTPIFEWFYEKYRKAFEMK